MADPAAGGQTLPSLEVTLAYVTVCGGDAGDWRSAWVAVEASPRERLSPPRGPGPFAVHYPYESIAEAVAFLDSAPLEDQDRARVAHANAERLLRLR
jgi:hypothetical protein